MSSETAVRTARPQVQATPATGARWTPAEPPVGVATLEAALDAMDTVRAVDFRTNVEPAWQVEQLALQLGRPDLHLRARLVLADVAVRTGDIAECGRIAHEVNAWANEHSHEYLLARSHHQLAVFFRHVGDLADALAHAVQCVAHTTEDCTPVIRARHLSTLAITLDENGSPTEALREFERALAIATEIDDGELQLLVLNNMAYTAYENHDEPSALDLVERMRAIEASGVQLRAHILDTIARIEMMRGNYAEAVRALRPLLDGTAGHLLTEGDALTECMLTTAEAQRLCGHIHDAQATLDRARQVCEERGLLSQGARVRREQAEVYAATHRYREAYEEHQAFHVAFVALQSAQRDARARALQAVFETEEARRASERFREMANRDALTGLYNRRYANDRLPQLIKRAGELGQPLSVALLDLDHFKRINDTLSHETGDLVLQQIAQLLAAVAGPGATDAVRLGGEEFLMIFADTDAEEAMRLCETLRAAIRGHHWYPVTGNLPVTTSIGVTTVLEQQLTASALLAQADRNLYSAKRSGRDRVVADPS